MIKKKKNVKNTIDTTYYRWGHEPIKQSKKKWYTIKWKPKHKIKNRIIKVLALNSRTAHRLLLKELAQINNELIEAVLLKKGGADDGR